MVNCDLERIKKELKGKKKSCFKFSCLLNRILITFLLTIICLIGFRKNHRFKSYFKDNVLSVNFDFAYFDKLYSKYFNSNLPFLDFFDKTDTVFSEKLSYDGFDDYLDGVSLNVSANYLVPLIDSGLVVFIGNKDGYGNTVIVEQANGIDVWYANIDNINAGLYEYVNKGDFIGEADSKLYLVFKKDGRVLNYKEFI